MRIVAPLLWANLFAWGTRMGRPADFYYVQAGCGILELLLFLTTSPDRAVAEKQQ